MKENKILLVTGASSDIGLALIELLSANYDTIVAHYNRSEAGLLALQDRLGDQLVLRQADFMEEAATEAFARSLLEQNLVPDHFVHLPALPLHNVKFAKTGWADFDKELNASFRSAVILSQAILPAMAKQKYGKVVFMLSFNVLNQPPIKFAVPYTSVKYALLGLLRGLSAEYAGKGVTVNGISPSMTETKFLDQVPQLIVEQNAAQSPMKRNLTVADLLPSFAYLLSDGADCVTGQNLAVTGGN